MFGFLDMLGNYEDRKVDRYENDKSQLTVSTARVTDADYPYETAVSHPSYKNDHYVIVQSYNTLKEAKAGHTKWVKTMTAKTLPKQLVDVMTSEIARVLKSVGGETVFKKKTFKKSKE